MIYELSLCLIPVSETLDGAMAIIQGRDREKSPRKSHVGHNDEMHSLLLGAIQSQVVLPAVARAVVCMLTPLRPSPESQYRPAE